MFNTFSHPIGKIGKWGEQSNTFRLKSLTLVEAG